MAKGKKSKKEAGTESEDSDVDVVSAADSLERVKLTQDPDKKKKKKDKSKSVAESDDDDDEIEGGGKATKSGFALLMEDAGDSLPSDGSDADLSEGERQPELVQQASKVQDKKKKKKLKKGAVVVEESTELAAEVKEEPAAGGKKKKKKGKKATGDDEDLDAMLAALRSEYSGEAGPEQGGGLAEQHGFEVIDGEEAGSTVKTAAQKKKEKKDRQKQKEWEEKEAAKTNKSKTVKETSVDKEPVMKQDSVENDEPVEANEEMEGDDSKKSKKKKGKKDKEKEEETKSKRKPNKAVLAAMQEALTKQKEEEERQRKEEEEKERLAEEAFQAKLEAKRKEEERRAAKKEREKQKKAELKAAGQLLTPAERAKRARAQATLEALKAQGIDVPSVGEKRGPRPGTRKRTNQKPRQQEEKEASVESESVSEVVEELKDEQVVPVEASPVESWDAEEDEEDVKDAWDADSDEEKKVVTAAKTVDAVEQAESDDEGSEEEEDSDESEEESSSEEEEEEEEDKTIDKRERAILRIRKRKEEHEARRSEAVLRAPVVCVLGHVDTGKTKILDKLRRTNVQDGEAGGITQQIGATNVPIAVVSEQCKMVREFTEREVRLPGLLIIDTPGHESFSNLRDRGSSLCDIAILVVDIMHGLEPQTLESINLLKKKKTPFVVALNKVDRLYEWKPNRHKDVREVIDSQPSNTRLEFQKRKDEVILGLAEQGLNAALFWENPDPADYISLVPTSAHSGDGMGNLMSQLVEISQDRIPRRLSYSEELQATVMEVKAIGGFGTTIDVALVNGRLKFGQTVVLPGTEGPIVTTIKALLTPAKMQDLRVKNQFLEHKDLQAAQGVKIAARELEKCIAGLSMRVAYHPDEVEVLKEAAEKELSTAINAIRLKPEGVFVQASTLGSLEALLEFLKTSKIPYAGVRIGPVVKKDVMRASTMLEHEEKYAVILAFDVKVERDAQEMADREGVKIFQADIIYHLFDRFTEYQQELVNQKKEQFRNIAVFPCKLRIMPENIFARRDPIVVGVKVEAGVLRTGTPICVPSKEFLYIGVCTGIQHNNIEREQARKGDEVCVKIEAPPGDAPKMFGRHFDADDLLMSRISRESIDACKDYFRDDLAKTDWALMVELKKLFQIL